MVYYTNMICSYDFKEKTVNNPILIRIVLSLGLIEFSTTDNKH